MLILKTFERLPLAIHWEIINEFIEIDILELRINETEQDLTLYAADSVSLNTKKKKIRGY